MPGPVVLIRRQEWWLLFEREWRSERDAKHLLGGLGFATAKAEASACWRESSRFRHGGSRRKFPELAVRSVNERKNTAHGLPFDRKKQQAKREYSGGNFLALVWSLYFRGGKAGTPPLPAGNLCSAACPYARLSQGSGAHPVDFLAAHSRTAFNVPAFLATRPRHPPTPNLDATMATRRCCMTQA